MGPRRDAGGQEVSAREDWMSASAIPTGNLAPAAKVRNRPILLKNLPVRHHTSDHQNFFLRKPDFANKVWKIICGDNDVPSFRGNFRATEFFTGISPKDRLSASQDLSVLPADRPEAKSNLGWLSPVFRQRQKTHSRRFAGQVSNPDRQFISGIVATGARPHS